MPKDADRERLVLTAPTKAVELEGFASALI